jgi:tRNA (adenine9-N1/guanine9-N1)-methyltransferase
MLFNDEGIEILRTASDGLPCDAQLTKETCEKSINLDLLALSKPRFIIDLTLWNEHTEHEKNELTEQILMSIHTMRKFLWDRNLELTNVPREFMDYLGKFAKGFINKVVIRRTGPYVNGDAVILDPQGDCLLNNSNIRAFSTFVIGGIVDKERKIRGETSRLYKILGLDIPRCRIELRGSIIGVPDRINKVIEIILKVLINGEDLEESIITSMSRRDRENRLFYELQRASYRVKIENNVILAITKQMLQRINWVRASERELSLAIKKSHIIVLSDEELTNYLSAGRARPGPWTCNYTNQSVY